MALRALDAIHSRAQYDLVPEVLLVTNAIKSNLKEPEAAQVMLEIEAYTPNPTKTNGVDKSQDH